MVAVGALGIGAVALYAGATILGGLLDPAYSHVGNAISAPLAVGTIGTDVMGLFERVTIGVYMVWILLVGIDALLVARAVTAATAHRGSVGVTV
jgi:hypothetical protein